MTRLSTIKALNASAVLLGGRVLGAVLGLVIQLLLARSLGTEGLGLVFFITSVVVIVGVPVALGYPAVAIRFISRYQHRGRYKELAGFIRRARADTIGMASAACLAMIVYSIIAEQGSLNLVWAFGALAVPSVAMIRVNGGISSALGHVHISYLPDLVLRPVLYLLILLTVVVLTGAVTPNAALFGFATSGLFVALAQHALLKPHISVLAAAPKTNRRLTMTWRTAGLPLVMLAAYTALFADCVMGMMGLLLSRADLAVFGICLKLTFLVGFSVQALHEFVAPATVALLRANDSIELEEALKRVNFISVLITGAATLAAAAFGSLLLSAFGADFAAGVGLLVALMVAQVIRAAAGPALTILIAVGAQRAIAIAVFATFLFMAFSAGLLVPVFGTGGAAATVVLSMLFSSITFGLILFRATGLRTDAGLSFGRVVRTSFMVPKGIRICFERARGLSLLRGSAKRQRS